MTLDEFLQYAQQRKPFEEPEMLRLMNEMSDEARRITCRLNAEYHTPDEIRALLSELFGRRVDPSLRSSRPSTPTSVRTSTWAGRSSSTPAATSRTTEG